jgi:hypothetical protein
MAGPYPPNQGTGASGPFVSPPAYSPDFGPGYREPYPFDAGPAGATYPGPLPPPVPYPRRRRGRAVVAALVALAAIAAIVGAVVWKVHDDSAPSGGMLTNASAKRAIQDYLNALSDGDLQAISRNALCGLYDGIKDRRSDDALARLSSEAFQKQFQSADVTSVDTMVFASQNSAQVLFTMTIRPGSGMRGSGPAERQGVAQLLSYDNQILVCSYILRTAGAF